MYRLFTIAVVLLWITAMTALFMRDVWPSWSAQDVPMVTAQEMAELEEPEQQFGIFRNGDERVATAWSDISRIGERVSIDGTILISEFGDFGFGEIGVFNFGELLIETETEFAGDGGLDSFRLDLFGLPQTRVHVRGERRGTKFPCELQFGPIRRQMPLDLSASRLIGDSFRPFGYLPTLEVGQRWRMQIMNPLQALGAQSGMTSIIATVTGREPIEFPEDSGKMVDCFVVETSPTQAKAWVTEDGRAIVQEVRVAGFGQVTVREEKYSGEARLSAERRIKHRADLGAVDRDEH